MAVADDNPDAQAERYERGKITLSRDAKGKPWWRVTVYIGDSAEDLDIATDEALRIDGRLAAEA